MARTRYQHSSERVKELLYKQKNFFHKLTSKSGLSLDEIQEVIERSVSIMTFSTLIGWDFGKRVNGIEALKGAAIGASIGLCLVIGHITIKIILKRHEHGFKVKDMHVSGSEDEASYLSKMAYA